jgi:THO complex subunit 4
MSIAYDSGPPRNPRRVASAPSSLLHRIQKPALADRLSQDDSSTTTPSRYVLWLLLCELLQIYGISSLQRKITGPIRSRRGGGRSAPRVPKKPKTAEDLDKELDLFMGDGPKEKDIATSATAPPTAADQGADVEMQ